MIWKKIEENNIGEIWEMFVEKYEKDFKTWGKLERNFREIMVK